MSRKLERQIKSMVFNELDKMRILFKKQIRTFSVKRLPLERVNKIIDLVKINEKSPLNEFKEFTKGFNSTLDSMKNACIEQSEIIGDEAISYSEFVVLINVVKDGFETGRAEAKQLIK